MVYLGKGEVVLGPSQVLPGAALLLSSSLDLSEGLHGSPSAGRGLLSGAGSLAVGPLLGWLGDGLC